MKRVVVVGNSGAGKSTLASELASRLWLPYIASDTFYWEIGWIPSSPAVVRQLLVDAVAGEAWVMDGNCIAERDTVWGKADTIIWLDYSLPLVMQRICMRNIKWFVTQERVWSGNCMTWSRAWSGIRHSARTYTQKKKCYPSYLAEFPHLEIIHFNTPREVKRWLTQITVQHSDAPGFP